MYETVIIAETQHNTLIYNFEIVEKDLAKRHTFLGHATVTNKIIASFYTLNIWL
jgi:hypothetical protein